MTVADSYAIVETRLEATSVGEDRDLVFVWLRTRAPTTFKFGDAIQELAGCREAPFGQRWTKRVIAGRLSSAEPAGELIGSS